MTPAQRHPRRVVDDARLARRASTKSTRIRPDAGAPQIQSVGIPAGEDGGPACGVAIAVQLHGFTQVFELRAAQLADETIAPQPYREVGSTRAMTGIVAIVVPMTVVQECEPGVDRRIQVSCDGNGAAVIPDLTPVGHPVNAVGEVETEHRS